jgi:hypothetical protein
LDAYDQKILAAIREIDEAESDSHPALDLKRVARSMQPVESDLERLDISIAKLTEDGFLRAAIPPLEQTIGPATFRLSR